MSVGTYWTWETTCYVAVCSAALGASAPTEGGEGRGHIVAAARLQLIIDILLCLSIIDILLCLSILIIRLSVLVVLVSLSVLAK